MNLEHYRKKRGMTQAALAAGKDVDRTHVSTMEQQEQNVTKVTRQKEADALGVEPAQLIAKTE